MPQDSVPDSDSPDAFLRASRTRVVVIGGGVAGLVAALEWAKVGAQVTVLEAADRVGGAIETATIDSLDVDLVADTLPLGAAPLGALLDELRLRDRVEAAVDLPVWVAGLPGGAAAPMPAATVLGVPANAWEEDVRRIIGWPGAWRAYLDRLRPPLTIGRAHSLGKLVRSRMGDRVVDRLVAPVARGRFGLDPDDIDVEAAAPGLNTALTRTGSLAGAVGELVADAAPPARGTLRGGLGTLVSALEARLVDLGAHVVTGTPVAAIRPGTDAAWSIETAPTAPAATDAAPATPEPTAPEPAATNHEPARAARTPHPADVVVLAVDAETARRLLESAGVAIDTTPTSRTDIVTLVVDAPELDAAPRGQAVYPADAGRPDGALGVVHPTAEWPWLAAAAAVVGPGRHVLRVTLPAYEQRDDDATIAVAAQQAAALLGVAPLALRAAARRTIVRTPPASALGHDDRVAAIRAAVGARPGLAVVGGWVAGSGIAAVVADAITEIDRQRGTVLWAVDEPPASF